MENNTLYISVKKLVEKYKKLPPLLSIFLKREYSELYFNFESTISYKWKNMERVNIYFRERSFKRVIFLV